MEIYEWRIETSNGITSQMHYLINRAKLCKNITEVEILTSLLRENDFITLDVELNSKQILGQNKIKKIGKSNNNIKLNL